MLKTIAYPLFLAMTMLIALASSYFYVGPTITLLQLACMGIGFLCLLTISSLGLRTFKPQKVATIAIVIFLITILAEISLFHYIHALIKQPTQILRFKNILRDYGDLLQYIPYAIWFVIQTLLIALYLKASLGESLIISALSCAATYLIVFLSWKYLLADTSKIELMLRTTQDLIALYLNAGDSEMYWLLQELREQLPLLERR